MVNKLSDKAGGADGTGKQPPARRVWRPDRQRAFRLARLVLLLTLVLAMVVWAAQWMRTAVLFVHETDARIMADLITVSSETDGRLLTLLAEEGDKIPEGQVLAVIDSRTATLDLAEAAAERNTLRAELGRLEAETGLLTEQIRSRIGIERARLAEARANQAIHSHELTFTENELRRVERLTKSGAISQARLDRVRTDYLKARQELHKAQAEITTAEAALQDAEADRSQLLVKTAEGVEFEARLAEVEARIARHKVDIEKRTLTSPIDGVVGRVFVNPGEYLREGQRLLVMHDPDQIRVEANIRETKLDRLAIGQTVKVEVDAYPEIDFEGRVSRIGNAATSQFALLPGLNESGTFTKVTQRIKVQIDLEQYEGKLRPGMMVEIYVDDGNAGTLGSWLR